MHVPLCNIITLPNADLSGICSPRRSAKSWMQCARLEKSGMNQCSMVGFEKTRAMEQTQHYTIKLQLSLTHTQ